MPSSTTFAILAEPRPRCWWRHQPVGGDVESYWLWTFALGKRSDEVGHVRCKQDSGPRRGSRLSHRPDQPGADENPSSVIEKISARSDQRSARATPKADARRIIVRMNGAEPGERPSHSDSSIESRPSRQDCAVPRGQANLTRGEAARWRSSCSLLTTSFRSFCAD